MLISKWARGWTNPLACILENHTLCVKSNFLAQNWASSFSYNHTRNLHSQDLFRYREWWRESTFQHCRTQLCWVYHYLCHSSPRYRHTLLCLHLIVDIVHRFLHGSRVSMEPIARIAAYQRRHLQALQSLFFFFLLFRCIW